MRQLWVKGHSRFQGTLFELFPFLNEWRLPFATLFMPPPDLLFTILSVLRTYHAKPDQQESLFELLSSFRASQGSEDLLPPLVTMVEDRPAQHGSEQMAGDHAMHTSAFNRPKCYSLEVAAGRRSTCKGAAGKGAAGRGTAGTSAAGGRGR